jgi:hypothetical protein
MINDINKVLERIKPNDRVIDVGGGAQVFPRANAVIDLVPYTEREYSEAIKDRAESFSQDDWYVGDICSSEVWKNFSDKEFDFVVCSHTLEDVRDPIFVCEQLIRVAKAGYIEVPSRFRECLKTGADEPISGWEHHRWVIDIDGGTIAFTVKHPFIHYFDFLGNDRREHAFDYFKQFTSVYWIGSFNYVERLQKGSPLETENLFYYYDCYDYEHPNPYYEIVKAPFKKRTIEWNHELPVEKVLNIEEIMWRHSQRLEHPDNPLPPFPKIARNVRAKDRIKNLFRHKNKNI